MRRRKQRLKALAHPRFPGPHLDPTVLDRKREDPTPPPNPGGGIAEVPSSLLPSRVEASICIGMTRPMKPARPYATDSTGRGWSLEESASADFSSASSRSARKALRHSQMLATTEPSSAKPAPTQAIHSGRPSSPVTDQAKPAPSTSTVMNVKIAAKKAANQALRVKDSPREGRGVRIFELSNSFLPKAEGADLCCQQSRNPSGGER